MTNNKIKELFTKGGWTGKEMGNGLCESRNFNSLLLFKLTKYKYCRTVNSITKEEFSIDYKILQFIMSQQQFAYLYYQPQPLIIKI